MRTYCVTNQEDMMVTVLNVINSRSQAHSLDETAVAMAREHSNVADCGLKFSFKVWDGTRLVHDETRFRPAWYGKDTPKVS